MREKTCDASVTIWSGERNPQDEDESVRLRMRRRPRIKGLFRSSVAVSRSSTAAGSQRSGTRSTSGIAQCAARATLTTEHVAEAAKHTLRIFGKKQQRTLATTAATKASERY